MKLSYIRESFDTFSSKVGELNRQMALAGIAIVWIFKTGSEKTFFVLPPEMYRPLYLFCASLLIDLFQYLYATIAWGIVMAFFRSKQDDDNVDVSGRINILTWVLFVGKVSLLIIGYIMLLITLNSHIK